MLHVGWLLHRIPCGEFLPQLPVKLILAGMLDASQSQTAAVRALRQAFRESAEAR